MQGSSKPDSTAKDGRSGAATAEGVGTSSTTHQTVADKEQEEKEEEDEAEEVPGDTSGAEEEQDGGDDEEASKPAGPSVFVPAGAFVPPQEDIKLLDARQLVVQGKVTEESEADKAQSTVSAFARVHNTKVRALDHPAGAEQHVVLVCPLWIIPWNFGIPCPPPCSLHAAVSYMTSRRSKRPWPTSRTRMMRGSRPS